MPRRLRNSEVCRDFCKGYGSEGLGSALSPAAQPLVPGQPLPTGSLGSTSLPRGPQGDSPRQQGLVLPIATLCVIP